MGKFGPLVRFLGLGTGLYIVWYVLYEFWLKDHTGLDEWMVRNLIWWTDNILLLFGFELWTDVNDVVGNYVGIANGHPLEVGAPCDGIVLLALFSCFILAFPGKWRNKLWFMPAGLIAIHLINVLRIFCLALIIHYKPSALDFNHDYTFTILVYGFVFYLWWIWINKLSPTFAS
jgi:exosortase family protein XrtF